MTEPVGRAEDELVCPRGCRGMCVRPGRQCLRLYASPRAVGWTPVDDRPAARLLDKWPDGLCGDRAEHSPHAHHSASLGRFWCTADQAQREPGRSERRRDGLASYLGTPST